MKKLLFLVFSLTLSINFAFGQAIACNDSIQVSVDRDCEALIHPDMILEGTYANYDDYDVRIYKVMPNPINSPGTEPNPIGVGEYIVGVFDTVNYVGNNCWGKITVMDKMPPTIECDCPEGGEFPEGSELSSPVLGSFITKDDIVEATASCIFTANGLEVGDHYYDVYPITVTSPGVYTFTGTDGNKFNIAILDKPFDPTKSCAETANDMVGQYLEDDAINHDGSAALSTGTTYYLVLSDLDKEYLGTYTMDIATPAGGEVEMAETVYTSECEYAGCYNPTLNYNFLLPEYDDNCEVTADDLTFVQTIRAGEKCGTYIVKRVYTITDKAGMKASCTSEYYFKGVDINNLTWPTNWDGLPNNRDMIECSFNYTRDAFGNPHPSYTGYPDGYSDACGTIEVFYNDQTYTKADGVPCGTKILRNWTVVDDCTGLIYHHTQIIRITDTEAPTFSNLDNMVAKTKAYECNANVKMPAIEHLHDNCDANPKWWISSTDGIVSGDSNNNGFVDAGETWYVNNLTLGDHKVCYHVIDDCGNEEVDCLTISVFDGVPPIPVCEQHKQVGITTNGNAKVFATSFDSGSFDNCNPVFFKALRVNDDLVYDGGCEDLNGDDRPATNVNDVWYDDEVFFCCEDVDKGIMVSLRVFDVDPGNGPIAPHRMRENGDLYGHFNDCWSVVNIESKIPPILDCPPITVSCEESLDPTVNPRLYPTVNSVCGYELDYTDKRDLGVCGSKIKRTWTATGSGRTSTCIQNITVSATDDFNPCTIVFPKDISADCADQLGDGHEPTWDENPCNVVTAEFKDDTFRFVEGACYKIVRNWAVVDWCVYEPNLGAEDNIDEIEGRKLYCNALVEDGYYRYTQILMVTDSQVPEIIVEDQCIASTDCYAYNVELTASATDECNVDQKFNWKYIVTNMDNWETVQYSYNYKPKPSQGVQGSVYKDKLNRTKYASLKLLNGLPVGNYRVIWTVGDGCGNATSKSQFFTIADKKAPTPLLVDIATAVMANGMVELKAISFDKGGCDEGCISSRDNCTPKSGLYFTFSPYLPKFDVEPLKWKKQLHKYGMNFFNPNTGLMMTLADYEAGNADAWLAGENTSQRRYLCDFAEDANYTKSVEIYVWDQFAYNTTCDDGNYDFATVEVNFNHCSSNPFPIVSGNVSFVGNTDLFEGMNITVDNGETIEKVTTNVNGGYSFNLQQGEYEIKGSRDIEYLNGVTTLDIVLIQKYLLGIKDITNPYYLIAADANKNGTVTASDLLEIRKVILGVKSKFENNSWIAISSDYTFNNPYKAFAEAEKAKVRKIKVEDSNISELNFVAVKIGDMNGSANALESRSANSIKLALDNIEMPKGEMVEVPFYAKDFNDVFGLQFTMNLNSANVVSINQGAISINESNINTKDGKLVLSWTSANETSVEDGDVLFTLTMKSNTDTYLNRAINISDNLVRAEAYLGSELEINSIDLDFRNDVSSYTLYQNEPNPFSTTTVIGFDLPEASNYKLTLYDVTGKELMIYNNNGNTGYNKVEISTKDINSTGVLYYRLESGDYTATKKMIVIK